MRPLWRDYSRYQGKVNHQVAKDNGVQGMIARAGISWGYQDSWFPHNWIEAGNVGYYRSSYHVLYPGENITRQADNWYKSHDELDTIPRVIDAELQHDSSNRAVGDAIWNMSEKVLERDGHRPWIYSRYMQLGLWLAHWTEEMINSHYYFLAQYKTARWSEHAGPPTLFKKLRRENVVLHQTADKIRGFPGESESYATDTDRWCLGDVVQMHSWIEEKYGTTDKPDVEPPINMALIEQKAYSKAITAIKALPNAPKD